MLKDLRIWDVLKRDIVFERSPWVRLWKETIRLPDGREIEDYYQFEQRDYVEIVAWKDGKVLGIWRYKHGPRNINLGFPAGYLEEDEEPLDAARRELQEEAGLASENWEHLGSYCIDGNRTQARAHIYKAYDCYSVNSSPSDDLEEHFLEWLAPDEWKDNLESGEINILGAAVAVYAGILAFLK